MLPTNHKTIFVLDHTPYFGISSDNPIDFEISKNRGPGYVPLSPVCKSLWTCSVEAAVEYCRVVWDLFPEGKLLRFIVSDSLAHILNTWIPAHQNLTHILNGLCIVGPVRRGAGGDVVGLCAAIEALGEASPIQAASDRHLQNCLRTVYLPDTCQQPETQPLSSSRLVTYVLLLLKPKIEHLSCQYADIHTIQTETQELLFNRNSLGHANNTQFPLLIIFFLLFLVV